MSFSQPPLVSSVSVGTQTYNFHSAAGTELYYKDPTKSSTYNIKYDWSLRTWQDGGSNHPLYVTHDPNGEFVYTGIGDFTNPYYEPPPPPEEPPTGTEGTSSTMSCLLTYNDATNTMHYYISETEPSTQFLGNRELFYRIRNATVVNGSTNININHYYGTHTTGDFNPTVYGVYHLERVLTNPLEVHSCLAEPVSQNAVDAWNAIQAAAAAAEAAAQAVLDAAAAAAAAAAQAVADALAAEAAAQAAADAAAVQAAADAAASAQAAYDAWLLAYANTPRVRRGNLNFW